MYFAFSCRERVVPVCVCLPVCLLVSNFFVTSLCAWEHTQHIACCSAVAALCLLFLCSASSLLMLLKETAVLHLFHIQLKTAASSICIWQHSGRRLRLLGQPAVSDIPHTAAESRLPIQHIGGSTSTCAPRWRLSHKTCGDGVRSGSQ